MTESEVRDVSARVTRALARRGFHGERVRDAIQDAWCAYLARPEAPARVGAWLFVVAKSALVRHHGEGTHARNAAGRVRRVISTTATGELPVVIEDGPQLRRLLAREHIEGWARARPSIAARVREETGV